MSLVFQFNPERNILKGGQFYNRNPTANDKVHVLVSVIDASKVEKMKNEIEETLQDIREEANDLGESRNHHVSSFLHGVEHPKVPMKSKCMFQVFFLSHRVE